MELIKIYYFIIKFFRIFRLVLLQLFYGKKLHIQSPLKEFNLSISTHVRIDGGGQMYLHSFSSENNVHFSTWKGILEIGNKCKFNRNDIIVAHERVCIGDNTVLGPNVCVYDHDHAFGENGKIEGEFISAPVIIGSNVWIGAGVIILRGTTIGDNCVIGAGCVIKGNIPKNSLVTGGNRDLSISPLE